MSAIRREHPPRTVRLRGRRTAGLVLTVVLLPAGLSACGIIGGKSNHGDAPVEISAGDATTEPTSVQASPTGSPAPVTATQKTTQVVTSNGVTVTRTGIVVRTETNTQTQTKTKTQQVTKVFTPPAVTNTQTQTQTMTQTATVTETKSVTDTKTVTVTCSGTPPVCK